MTPEEFYTSLTADSPPGGLNNLLQALWHDGKGDWEQAHSIAQDVDTAAGALIHAYLHRKEGDLFNAGYWYSCAGRPRPTGSLEEEWQALVQEFL